MTYMRLDHMVEEYRELADGDAGTSNIGYNCKESLEIEFPIATASTIASA